LKTINKHLWLLNKGNTFKLFALSVVLMLVLPDLVQHGMFMDGVQYAIVSKNMAFEKGSFWLPYLSGSWNKEYNTSFIEHLPLTYFLQSGFFLLFGNSVFTEKFYCFCTVVICMFLIYKIWSLLFNKNQALSSYWWLAILFWFITPSVFWSFRNNMLENTVSVMVLAACYFALRSVYENKGSLIFILLASIFVFLASLSKGLPGLFPAAIIFCFYVTLRKISLTRTIYYTLILLLVPAIIYLLIFFLVPNAAMSITFYLKSRLLARINNSHTVDNRFTILFWLLTDLLINLAFGLILILFFKLKIFARHLDKTEYQLILFFSLFGFCGVLPLCMTHVQRAVYFVPALPFFAFAFAIFFARGIDELITKINERVFKYIRIIVFIFLFSTIWSCIILAGKTGRDYSELSDVNKIGKLVGHDKSIAVPFEIYDRWDFNFYLLRYYAITLYPYPRERRPYKIFLKTQAPDSIKEYEKINAHLENYELFKMRN
jgi:4-amino-4-deoxy-L-arabinose transferase-like glycosyltransferase